jgi:hypothetical protein
MRPPRRREEPQISGNAAAIWALVFVALVIVVILALS